MPVNDTIDSELNSMEDKTDKKTMSSRLQDLLENENLTKKMVKKLPAWTDELEDLTPSSVIAANLISKALGGDQTAISAIQKIAYGDQITIDTKPGFFESKDIIINIVDPKHKEDAIIQDED